MNNVDIDKAGFHSPWFTAPPIRALCVKILRSTQKGKRLWMLLAFNRETVVDVSFVLEHIDKTRPKLPSLSRSHEGGRIANKDKTVSSAREEYI